MSNCIPDLEMIQGQLNEIIKLIKPKKKRLKRYWLFAWWDYEAGGGMNDFIACFDSEKEAMDKKKDLMNDKGYDSFSLFDSENLSFGKDSTWIETEELIQKIIKDENTSNS